MTMSIAEESTLVVVPTYNEAANVERLTMELLAYENLSVLIIDDNSPDSTGHLADGLSQRYPDRMSVLHRSGKLGLASAYILGFQQALSSKPTFVVQMDADFSHSPADVPRLVAAARNADVAIGSRYVCGGCAENWPLIRRVISRGGSLYTRAILGLPVQDPTSGFKCFRREALAQIDFSRIRARGFGFMVEVNWHCHRQGLRLAEVPICFVDRKQGQSKMSRQIFFEALLLVWRLRFKSGAASAVANLPAS
jgi:dolichol-phosphate mannosyltransferase